MSEGFPTPSLRLLSMQSSGSETSSSSVWTTISNFFSPWKTPREEPRAADFNKSKTSEQPAAGLSKDFNDLPSHRCRSTQTANTSQTKKLNLSDNSCSVSTSQSQGAGGDAPPPGPDPPRDLEKESDSGSEYESSDSESCCEDESSSKEEVRLKVVQQNCRSLFKLINEKSPKYAPEKLLKLMEGQNVLVLTETWLEENYGKVAKWLEEHHYEIINVPRPVVNGKKRGGGVAIAYPKGLSCQQVRFEDTSTFEYVVVDLAMPGARETVRVVGIYRPPGAARTNKEKNKFLKELRDLLCDVYDTSDMSTVHLSEESEESGREREIGDRKVIIGGDFNLWVNNPDKDKAARAVKRLLRKFRSAQHVSGPTQNKGNTLDLVFASPNVQISDVSVQDHGISDHYAVYFTAEVRLKKKRGTKKPSEKKE